MRIITGKAKGVRIETLSGEATRPTAERVKEAVFSMLQFDIEGREVLDLFAGSGQLGLEALSRGAEHAVLIDKSREAVKIINTNVTKTKLGAYAEVFCMDYSEYIKRFGGRKFDLIFIDPPYSAGLYSPALRALLDGDMLKSTSIIVCESENEDIFGKDSVLAEKFKVDRMSRYGRVIVSLLSPIL